MKTYEELIPAEQAKAQQKALQSLLQAVCDGSLRFNDSLNGDDLQARIDAAGEKAEKMQTPWFWSEIIMEDGRCADSLRGMAQCDAEDAFYSSPSETVVAGVVTEEAR